MARKKAKPKKPHLADSTWCMACAKWHSKNVHRFHGKGSYARTHK